MRTIKLLSIIGIIILLSACGNSPSGKYTINKTCRTNSELVLNSVDIKDDKTIIELTFCNEDNYGYTNIKTAAPGTNQAFYLKDTQSDKKYNLLDTENVAITPNRNVINAGECLTFRLIFNKIDITSFHLIEGEEEPSDYSTPWHFTNVELKR